MTTTKRGDNMTEQDRYVIRLDGRVLAFFQGDDGYGCKYIVGSHVRDAHWDAITYKDAVRDTLYRIGIDSDITREWFLSETSDGYDELVYDIKTKEA